MKAIDKGHYDEILPLAWPKVICQIDNIDGDCKIYRKMEFTGAIL